MKASSFLALAVWAALFLPACSSPSGDAVLLKFNLQKGKTYAYSLDIEMQGDASGQKLRNNMDFDYEMAVTNDNAGVKTIAAVYKRIGMDMDTPAGKVAFDTGKPADTASLQGNPLSFMGGMFRGMVGKGFEMKVDAAGKVMEITGVTELADAVVNGSDVPAHMKNAVRQGFASQFNEQSLKQTFSQGFDIFPNKEVRVGDKWNKTVTVGGGAAGEMKTTYTLKEIKKDEVLVDAVSEIEMRGTTLKQSGTMRVDPVTGLVMDANLRQDIGGTVQGKGTITIRGKEL